MSSLTTGHMSYHVTNRVGSTNRIVILVVLCSLRDVLTQDTSGTIQSCARNGCQNFVDEGEYQHCRCVHLNSDKPGCIDGCQSVSCMCYRRPGFNCTLWCRPSSDPFSPGCDCSGLWNIGKSTPERVTRLMQSSSLATTTATTTTEDDDHEMSDCRSQENTPVLTPLEISSMVLGSSIFMILLAAVICMVRKVFTDIPIVPPQKSRSDDREEGSVTSSDNLISSAPRSPVDTGELAAFFIFSQHQDIGRTSGRQEVRTRGGQDARTSGFQDSASSQTSGLATYSTVHQSTSDQDSEHALYTQTGYSSGTYDELRNLAFVSHSPARLPSFNGWNSGATDRSYSGSASTNGSVLDNSSILDLVINRN